MKRRPAYEQLPEVIHIDGILHTLYTTPLLPWLRQQDSSSIFDLRTPNCERGYIGDFRNREWAGATFSPDGRWLFANIQTPGITFAITGPWNDGAFAVKQRDDDDDDDEDEDD